MAVIAYLFLLSGEQDTGDQKAMIEAHAGEKSLRVDSYITIEASSGKGERGRRIEELFVNMSSWDVVMIPDLSLIGHSVAEVVSFVGSLSRRGIRLIAVRQGMDMNGPGDAQSKVTAHVFDMLAGLEKEFASARIKGALAGRKKDGVVLGRPKGSISPSKLDGKKELIVEYLSKGVSKASLARILETSPSNLLSYLKTRKIETTERVKRPRTAVSITKKDVLPKREIKEGGPKDVAAVKPAEEQRRPTSHIEETKEVVLCRHCGKNVLDPRTTTCAGGYVDYLDNESHRRVRYSEDEKERCPRCGVEPGGFHHDGCYMERCPRCGERLVSCACKKV